jgi:hypothetical protein
VKESIVSALKDVALFELDPNKHYILILPSDISVEDSKEAFASFREKINLVVLHTDNAKLLELA